MKFIYTGASARALYYLSVTSFSVGVQSNVLIYDNSSAINGALNVSGSVTLNNPQSFVVLNANRAAMAPGVATNLTGTQITDIRYFTGASQIAGVYDPVNREYIGTDASPFARWWIQNSFFNVTANNWPASAPSGVTTSPLYSSANVPGTAVGAETTLTSSNFGLNTSIAYGIAIKGETNVNITLEYFFDGVLDPTRTTVITPSLLSTVNVSDVALATTPVGYTLSSTPTSPTLPASAQSLDGQTVNIYYVTDPAQTATMNIEYYFDGTYDPSFDDSITRQALDSVTLADVELTPVPVGYTLDTAPTNPTLPQTAYTLDGTAISVFYVLDVGQTATIDVGYYFNGVFDASFSTTINPQILDTVTEADVILGTTPTGYMLDTVPTSPVLPESAQILNGTTINVYYVTDPSQTAIINIQYYFDGVLDASRDTSITRQVLSAVGLADVTLASVPAGYTLAATPTSPVLPQSALGLDGTTVSVFYVTDADQTATISVGYYFNGTLDASYSTTINPQLFATVNLSDVTLATVPAGYMLSSTPTSPVLPQSAQTLNGTTINVFYVADPSQTTAITLNYYFDGTYDPGFDATITPQVLSSVSLADVTLSPTPVGYMLAAIPTDPLLPASAQLLDGSTVNVYYVTNPNQTAPIHIAYYLNGVLNPAYNATITPHILAQVNVADVVLETTPVGYMLDAVPTSACVA